MGWYDIVCTVFGNGGVCGCMGVWAYGLYGNCEL